MPVLSPDWQVLKVAILAEKYAVDYSWYVDTILNLIRIAGDYVSEEVWYRVLQIVTNRDDVQGYAAKTVFEVSTPTSPTSGGTGGARTAGAAGPRPAPSSSQQFLGLAGPPGPVWGPRGAWCAVAAPQVPAVPHLAPEKGSHSVLFCCRVSSCPCRGHCDSFPTWDPASHGGRVSPRVPHVGRSRVQPRACARECRAPCSRPSPPSTALPARRSRPRPATRTW